MTNDYPDAPNVRFVCDIEGLCRLRLVSTNSQVKIKTLITNGESEVQVPAGEYYANLEILGGERAGWGRVVKVSSNTTEIDLGQDPNQEDQKANRARRSPRAATHNMLRRSAQHQLHPYNAKSRQGKAIDNAQLAPASIDDAQAKQFCVGVSEDTRILRQGGWQTVKDLKVQAQVSSDGELTLTFETEALGFDRRLRATLAIDGKAAVRMPVPLYAGGVQICVTPTVALEGLDALIAITPANPAIAALTTAMAQLSDVEIDRVLALNDIDRNSIVNLFAGKQQDPWTATAAAVLLVRLRALEGMASWANRLADMAPYIADTSVIAAWAMAAVAHADKQAHEQTILNQLIEGRRRGAPTYHTTHTLALDLLSVLSSTATTAQQRASAHDEQKIWRRRGRSRIDLGSYLAWEQTGNNLRNGKLPKERYSIVAEGELAATGFSLE